MTKNHLTTENTIYIYILVTHFHDSHVLKYGNSHVFLDAFHTPDSGNMPKRNSLVN